MKIIKYYCDICNIALKKDQVKRIKFIDDETIFYVCKDCYKRIKAIFD